MKQAIGLLNGADIDLKSLSSWLSLATEIYAADGAADVCLSLGFNPVVVGDQDSVKADLSGLRVERIVDQDFSDCQKLLEVARQDNVEHLIIAGHEGNRPDHVIATLSALAASPLQISLLYRLGAGLILKTGQTAALEAPKGQTFSVIPLPITQVTVTGAQWPLERAILALGERISISNQSEGNTVISAHTGQALVYIPQNVKPGNFPWRITETPSG
jgi:thiamine pyrophosphokinase